MAPIMKFLHKTKVFACTIECSGAMGGRKTKISKCIDPNYTQMGHGVSCPHICVNFSSQSDVSSKSY